MKKKGFTLIELLAVIIILGILMLIAIPSIAAYINSARKDTYVNSVREIIKGATIKVNDGDLDVVDPDTTYYIHVDNIELENGNLSSPFGEMDDAYVVVTTNGEGYDYYFVGKDSANMGVATITKADEIDSSSITNVNSISTGVGIGSRNQIVIIDKDGQVTSTDKLSSIPDSGNQKISTAVNNCTYSGELVEGAEYVNGQYTYRYGQFNIEGVWKVPNDVDTDGWGVILTDKESTDPVTTKLCTSINDKPILFMASMFYNSNTTSIDLSSFNTKDVVSMNSMFKNTPNLTTLDVTPLNTSNVSDMIYMFSHSGVHTLNLSNFDTSNVIWMPEMFSYSGLTSIDINGFNIDKVVSMGSFFTRSTNLKRIYMDNWDFSSKDIRIADSIFGGLVNLEYISMKNWKLNTQTPQLGVGWAANSTKLETIDVTGWDLSKTTSVKGLFQQVLGLKNIVGLDTLDLSNVTDASNMFVLDREMTTLDLSGLDFSNVTNVNDIFSGANSLTTVYARNEADANKLNASSNKPSGLTVTVK